MNDEQIVARYTGTNLESALVWANEQADSPTSDPPVMSHEERYEIQRDFLSDGLISDEISLASEWDLTAKG